jgi:hypothetical protein
LVDIQKNNPIGLEDFSKWKYLLRAGVDL